MIEHIKIIDDLAKLSYRKRVAFAAACAECIASIVKRLGSEASVSFFKSGLETLWSVAAGRHIDLANLLAAIRQLPESSVDDSHLPQYHAMLALSVLAYALELAHEDKVVTAEWVCTAMVDIVSGFDSMLQPESFPQIIDPRNPSAPGNLEASEILRQEATLRALAGAEDLSDALIESLRRAAQAEAAKVEQVCVLLFNDRV